MDFQANAYQSSREREISNFVMLGVLSMVEMTYRPGFEKFHLAELS